MAERQRPGAGDVRSAATRSRSASAAARRGPTPRSSAAQWSTQKRADATGSATCRSRKVEPGRAPVDAVDACLDVDELEADLAARLVRGEDRRVVAAPLHGHDAAETLHHEERHPEHRAVVLEPVERRASARRSGRGSPGGGGTGRRCRTAPAARRAALPALRSRARSCSPVSAERQATSIVYVCHDQPSAWRRRSTISSSAAPRRSRNHGVSASATAARLLTRERGRRISRSGWRRRGRRRTCRARARPRPARPSPRASCRRRSGRPGTPRCGRPSAR